MLKAVGHKPMMQTRTITPVIELMKQDVVQSVVHDLRTPITVIKGYLQLLLSGVMGEMSSEQVQLLQRSVGPLEDLIQMTDNLLQSLNLDKADFELRRTETDLDHLLAEAVEFYQVPFQQRQMAIYREGNTLGLKIRVDAFWLRRVLNNLIWNAFKFTPDGGKVTLHVCHKADGLEVSIQDTGRGISAERIDRIFSKFEQAMPSLDRKQGTGLGLWICKRVLELHHGRIYVTSTEGQGTRFSLWLPTDAIL